MNTLLERIAKLYAPLGQRGLLMDGHYRFAPDRPALWEGTGDRKASPKAIGRKLSPTKKPAHI